MNIYPVCDAKENEQKERKNLLAGEYVIMTELEKLQDKSRARWIGLSMAKHGPQWQSCFCRLPKIQLK